MANNNAAGNLLPPAIDPAPAPALFPGQAPPSPPLPLPTQPILPTVERLREPWQTIPGWNEQAARAIIARNPIMRELIELPKQREVWIRNQYPSRLNRNLTKAHLMGALVQSRGVANIVKCGHCKNSRKIPFDTCVSWYRCQDGSCASHIWLDKPTHCGWNKVTGAHKDSRVSNIPTIVARENTRMLRELAGLIGQRTVSFQFGADGVLLEAQLVAIILGPA